MSSTRERQDAVDTLAALWDLCPDVRLGQLIAHLGFLGETQHGRGLSDLEDDELRNVFSRHREELLARAENTNSDRSQRVVTSDVPASFV